MGPPLLWAPAAAPESQVSGANGTRAAGVGKVGGGEVGLPAALYEMTRSIFPAGRAGRHRASPQPSKQPRNPQTPPLSQTPGGKRVPVKTSTTLRLPRATSDANAARERSRVQTLRHAFLELQRTLPSVPPDTKLSKLDVLLLATTYIAHLTRSLQDDAEAPVDPGLGALRGDGYLHPVKKWPMRSRLYIGATGQFLKHSVSGEKTNHDSFPTDSQP
uniref:Transcription factor 24 n=1 Tax=Camelus bactrianus TaxID=9837 RepID=A0A9W3H861_CAMBA|nr:transcription factor 24 [Camelus bactrianus]